MTLLALLAGATVLGVGGAGADPDNPQAAPLPAADAPPPADAAPPEDAPPPPPEDAPPPRDDAPPAAEGPAPPLEPPAEPEPGATLWALPIGDPSQMLTDDVVSERGLQVKTILAARSITAAFPQINSMIGVRPDSQPWHPSGRALDIMIPNPGSSEGVTLGDQIVAYAMRNADRFALQDVIWRGTYYTPAGPASGGYGHYDHVHITTFGGGHPAGDEQYLRADEGTAFQWLLPPPEAPPAEEGAPPPPPEEAPPAEPAERAEPGEEPPPPGAEPPAEQRA